MAEKKQQPDDPMGPGGLFEGGLDSVGGGEIGVGENENNDIPKVLPTRGESLRGSFPLRSKAEQPSP